MFANSKHHQAGVTFCQPFLTFGECSLLTGSYDCSLAQWDLRKLSRLPIDSLSVSPKSVWDIKYARGILGVACVYDGYLFTKKLAPLSELQFGKYEAHQSICYAFEPVTDKEILTSSFYDSTLHLIQH